MAKWRSARAERAHLIAVMRAGGKTWAEIAQDFRQRYRVNARVAMRLAHGWSQAVVAQEWSKRWPDDPRSDQNLSTWERWPESGHAPSLSTLTRLAEIYQCNVSHLVADLGCYEHLDDAGRQVPAALTASVAQPGRGTPTTVVIGVTGTSILQRGSAEQAVELQDVDLQQPSGRENLLTWSPACSGDGSTPTDVATIKAMSEAFRTADRRLGGGGLYGAVTRYLNTEMAPRLLTPTSATPDAALFSAAASLTEAAGWMAHDGGTDQLAHLHFIRALKLATLAGESTVIANVCASMSHLASQGGKVHEGLRMAERGLAEMHRKRTVGPLLGRLHAMRALALAGQNEQHACRAALGRAERALTADNAEDLGWTSHFDEASLAIEAAACLYRIGDGRQAETEARRAIVLRCGDRVRSRAFAHITLAQVLAAAGRIDEAASIGTDVCEVARTLTSARVLHQLSSLRLALDDHGSLPEVAQFLMAFAEIGRRQPSADLHASWPT